MLRNRSRSAMTTKQQPCSSSQSVEYPGAQNYKRQVPSFFGSPRFKAFRKALAETDAAAAAINPTSIPDTKLFSPFCNNNPFFLDHHDIIKSNPPKSPRKISEDIHTGIGLALFDASSTDKALEENSCSVLFGTKLRVESPPFPITQSRNFPSGSANELSGTQTKANCTEPPTGTEMELSEEYTCIVSHGPNPKTTHIFDNCILENYCSLSDIIMSNNSAPENFLSFCHTCKKNLEQKNDIYMYRGEKAFCSQECRYHEMLLDEQVED